MEDAVHHPLTHSFTHTPSKARETLLYHIRLLRSYDLLDFHGYAATLMDHLN